MSLSCALTTPSSASSTAEAIFQPILTCPDAPGVDAGERDAVFPGGGASFLKPKQQGCWVHDVDAS